MTGAALPVTAPRVVRLADPAATDALGHALAAMVARGFAESADAASDGFTVHLSGDLGVGKTAVVRALLRKLGVTGRIKSPTYALVESYAVAMPQRHDASVESRRDLKLNCHHFDFYRLEDPHDWEDAGFRDDFADDALRLVEWPERALTDRGSLLPPPDLRIALAIDGGGRTATLSPGTARGAAWLTALPFPAGDASFAAPSAASSPPGSPDPSRRS